MRTCLVGQSKLFCAGLVLILRDTLFAVESQAESVHGIVHIDHQHELILVQKPDRIANIAGELKALKNEACPPWIVLLAQSIELDELASSFASGADGYLLEDISPEALLDCLHLVTLGEKVFPSQLAELMCDADRTPGNRTPVLLNDALLSHRELHIVQWLTEGASNKVIAAELGISEATVKVHVKTILRKLGARNRTQAAMWAVQKGLSSNLLPPHEASNCWALNLPT